MYSHPLKKHTYQIPNAPSTKNPITSKPTRISNKEHNDHLQEPSKGDPSAKLGFLLGIKHKYKQTQLNKRKPKPNKIITTD